MDECRRQQYLKLIGVNAWQCKIARPERPLNTLPAASNIGSQTAKKTAVIQPEKSSQAVIVESVVDVLVADESTEQVEAKTAENRAEPTQSPIFDTEEPNWQTLQIAIQNCQLCELHQTRQQALIGEGNQQADVLFIGLGPNDLDDKNTQIISAEAGQLLDAMLKAIGLNRSTIYLLNLLKCKLPEGREPHTSELLCCENFLQQQISLLQPKVIYAMGAAANQLLLSQQSLSIMRRRAHSYNGIPVVVSLSPSQLLQNPADKRKAWQDLLQLKKMF